MGKNKHARIQLEDSIRDFLNQSLRQELADPHLQFVSITKVKLNADASVAQVYWDTFNVKIRGDAKKAIEGAKGRMRTLMSKEFKMRKVPALEILYDAQFEEEQKIDSLLKEEAKQGKHSS